MVVNVGQMDTTVRALDSQALLTPAVLEQITRIVLKRVREEMAQEARAQRDRELGAGATESNRGRRG